MTHSIVVNELLSEIEAADSHSFLPIDMKDGEKIIGAVSPYARKLFAMMRYYSQEEDLQKVRAGHASDDPSLMTEYLRLHCRYQAFHALFWLVVRAECEITSRDIGVRKRAGDWIVVEAAANDFPGMPPGLRAIFGDPE